MDHTTATELLHQTDHIPPTPAQRKLRVLCLHGFRTSATILKDQIEQRWDDSVLRLMDMTYLDAPSPCTGKSEVEGIFPPPYYEWFQYNFHFTEYTGLEDCIQYISNFMYENGPFDGLLGFSQGAILTAALVGLQRKGLALVQHPPLQFALIVSGGMFKNSKWRQDCYSAIIKCPSLHFIGENDWLKPKNEELLQVFENPTIVRHNGKHSIPRLDEEGTRKVQTFLQEMSTMDCNFTNKYDKDSIKEESLGVSEMIEVSA